MGNRALRKQASTMLKKHGVKLYTHNKRVAYRFLSAALLRDIISEAAGDEWHNLKISSIKPHFIEFSTWYGLPIKGKVFLEFDVTFENISIYDIQSIYQK